MQINHLHLHVRDVEHTRAFYERWFGMRLKRVIAEDFIFLTDDGGMDLALAASEEPVVMPGWFHFGFRLGDAGAVRTMHARMREDGVCDEELGVYGERVTFGLTDPDGYGVEVYFEPEPEA